jgi:hypothetical protein
MEVLLNDKSELFIHLSFSWFTFPFINVDDVPLLMKTIVPAVDANVSVLLVNVANNFNYFTSLIDNITVLVSEKLPPS